MRLWLNSSSFSARCTFRPRIDWATRLSFRAEVRSVRSLAWTSVPGSRRAFAFFDMLLPLGLLVGRVTREVPRRGELAQLVAEHVFRHGHGHMLEAIVNPEHQADELRHDGGAARPGLDHILAAGGLRDFCLLQQVAVDKRALPD